MLRADTYFNNNNNNNIKEKNTGGVWDIEFRCPENCTLSDIERDRVAQDTNMNVSRYLKPLRL